MKKALPILIILLLLVVIKNNIGHIYGFLTKGTAVNTLADSLKVEKKENKYLQERLKYVKTDKFVEEEAQDKLGMLKEGEFFVIAPTAAPLYSPELNIDTKPNWKKWLELFF